MRESDGGSSSASPDEHRDASQVRCKTCDGPIDTSDWYPVTQERDEDDTLHIHAFCCEGCRETWLDGRED